MIQSLVRWQWQSLTGCIFMESSAENPSCETRGAIYALLPLGSYREDIKSVKSMKVREAAQIHQYDRRDSGHKLRASSLKSQASRSKYAFAKRLLGKDPQSNGSDALLKNLHIHPPRHTYELDDRSRGAL